MIGEAERQRDEGERRIDGGARRIERGTGDEEIGHAVNAAFRAGDAEFRVRRHARGAEMMVAPAFGLGPFVALGKENLDAALAPSAKGASFSCESMTRLAGFGSCSLAQPTPRRQPISPEGEAAEFVLRASWRMPRNISSSALRRAAASRSSSLAPAGSTSGSAMTGRTGEKVMTEPMRLSRRR